MNYTQNTPNNFLDGCAVPAHFAQFGTAKAEGALTNYKKVVDNEEKFYLFDSRDNVVDQVISIRLDQKHYGLFEEDLKEVKEKLNKQNTFLKNTYLHDKINNNYIPLIDLVMSAYHSPKRYYSEIQNRVNTLVKVSKDENLVPIFMTLTLPSEYHRCKTTKSGKLIVNSKYNGTTPKEASQELTKLFAKIRHDRSLKDLTKDERIYFRANEPHKDGTPHTHILMFIPKDRVEKVKNAYKRLYDKRANDIQIINDNIDNSVAYLMKYINKLLPLSKKEKLSEKEEYLNAWYSHNKIHRFNSSRSLAPLSLYRLLHSRFSLYALTKIVNRKELTIYEEIDSKKILSVFDGDEIIYEKGLNFDIKTLGNNFPNYSQASDSALERLRVL